MPRTDCRPPLTALVRRFGPGTESALCLEPDHKHAVRRQAGAGWIRSDRGTSGSLVLATCGGPASGGQAAPGVSECILILHEVALRNKGSATTRVL